MPYHPRDPSKPRPLTLYRGRPTKLHAASRLRDPAPRETRETVEDEIKWRPKTRADCRRVPRPCPYVGCFYNNYLEIQLRDGVPVIRRTHPGTEPENVDPKKSCLLDLTDLGPLTLDAVGDVLGLTRERIRQNEQDALKKIEVMIRRQKCVLDLNEEQEQIQRRLLMAEQRLRRIRNHFQPTREEPMSKTITWQQVPGWFNFNDVYDMAVERAPRTGAHFVEVGVLFGKSALYMAEAIRKSGKSVAFDAVDTFNYGAHAVQNVFDKYRKLRADQDLSRLDELLDVARSGGQKAVVDHVVILSGMSHLVNVVKSSGQVWACQYASESLDFVYVDALHTRDDTESLLRAYVPKIKPGGMLAGHDYDTEYNGVKDAVRVVLGPDVEVRRQSFVWTKR